MAKKDRSNAYFMKRLQKEFPKIFDDYKAGKYSSQRKAFIAAGYVTPSNEFRRLKNAWARATPFEKADFLDFIKAPTATKSFSSIIDSDRHLRPDANIKIMRVMRARGLKPGDIMKEIGVSPLNVSLGQAMRRKKLGRIQLKLAVALTEWLNKQECFKSVTARARSVKSEFTHSPKDKKRPFNKTS